MIADQRPGKVLSVYLGEDLKREWTAFCAANNTTSSEAMRRVVQKLTRRDAPTVVPLHAVREMPDTTRRRIELRLSASELAGVEKRASLTYDSPNNWIVNLVRANLTQSPQLGGAELHRLGASNSQLLAIGRNLNQIARSMNANRSQAVFELRRIDEVYKFILAHTSEVASVMRANLDRWVVE